MHTFINSRPMAQLVALDLMNQEARRAQARRARRVRSPRPVEPATAVVRSPRWRVARVLHLAH